MQVHISHPISEVLPGVVPHHDRLNNNPHPQR